jgi:hypothetical protein
VNQHTIELTPKIECGHVPADVLALGIHLPADLQYLGGAVGERESEAGFQVIREAAPAGSQLEQR